MTGRKSYPNVEKKKEEYLGFFLEVEKSKGVMVVRDNRFISRLLSYF